MFLSVIGLRDLSLDMRLLDEYIAQLSTVRAPADLLGPHADWIWGRRNDVAAAVAELNEELRFNAAGQFQPHIMTTSVGDVSGILFVSANPGWSRKPNQIEDELRRRSIHDNRNFCSNFFTVFRREVGGNRWWSRALLLAHLIKAGSPAAGMPLLVPRQRWAWAQAGGLASGVGNVDLIPLHSTSDKFGTLTGDSLSSAQQKLRGVATATLRMVLEFEPAPHMTFVASALGARVTELLCEELNMRALDSPVEDVGHCLWGQLNRWVHPNTGAKVMTFPHQVFAGYASINLPPGFMVPLAARIRAFLDEPVT